MYAEFSALLLGLVLLGCAMMHVVLVAPLYLALSLSNLIFVSVSHVKVAKL